MTAIPSDPACTLPPRLRLRLRQCLPFRASRCGPPRENLALLDSQAGPHAARVLTTRPTLPEFSLESPLFRAILLRRLRLPLPLTSADTVAAHTSVLVVTTSPPARAPAFCGRGAAPSSVLLHVCAKKLGQLSLSM